MKTLGLPFLSDAELLAIILGSGSRDKSAVELARTILAKYDNNLSRIEELNIKTLTEFNGVGEAKAISILSALELGRRSQVTNKKKEVLLKTSMEAYEVAAGTLGRLSHEECWVLFLNRKSQLIGKKRMSSGGITATVIDVRMILRSALEHLATGIILCHNHPSGNLKPSRADKNITKKLLDACQTMDLKLIDHLIVTKSGYYSFADEGDL